MSIKVMNAIWGHSPEKGAERLLVLLALADWADDEGRCFPSMRALAVKARINERSARRIVRYLEETVQVVSSRGGGRGRRSQYRVVLPRERGTQRPPLERPQRGTLATQRGTLTTAPPNNEPSREPSVLRARARGTDRSRDRGLREIGEVLREAQTRATRRRVS